ncbi:tetratricopeptide repeat protein [Phenylobacterium sp.]|jgi:tetratricopeptide (TPR) repeat protein|uniref:tetratricopeptide repeat protein n=1 Tax=Phenylobacterium sp. TaxID=1871053 RepID=UPI002F423028
MRLRRALRGGVAAVCIGGIAAPTAVAPPAAAAASAGLDVRVAQARDFSRVEFRGAGRPAVKRDGQTLTFTFGRDGDPDISRLRVSPPRWIKTAEARHGGGRLQVVVTLADGADAVSGEADGATFFNAFQKADPAAAASDPAKAAAAPQSAAAVEPEPQRPNPIPAGGVVRMQAAVTKSDVILSFPWAAPNGAAVFRRGDAVWVVFDAPAAIDVSRAPRGVRQFSSLRAVRGADYAAVRIAAPREVPVFASAQGSVWSITLGPAPQDGRTVLTVGRDDAGGPAALQAAVAGVTRIVRVADPVVGDDLPVVTALGPPKGLPSRREFVQVAFLPSAQGLAMESYVDDLTVSHDGDLVHVGRPSGLALSPAWAIQAKAGAELGAPQAAAMPALVDEAAWSKTGSGGFMSRYEALLDAAGEEAGKGDKAPVGARMAMARFLVGSQLSFEAIGLLNDLARAKPGVMDDPEFRGLRGVARVMARRYKEAQADFSAPVLVDDPSSALWRSYIASQLAQWTEARQQFGAGADAFSQFSPLWRARFARADAQAALALGDLDGAGSRLSLSLAEKTDAGEELASRLLQARLAEAQGQKRRALGIYLALIRAPQESLSAPALLRATQIKLETGAITPAQAAQVFDGLRYRWRGDSTELETIRTLGQLYLSQGRYREALEALRSAGVRRTDLPEALQLQTDLAAAFRGLFLDGLADGLQPVQALALFYDFKELTPIGADGDLMVRKLVRRLVDVDLLDQAAELLRYQVDNRLDGVPRAQVATDLAVIYLMDKQPEKALEAINGSRTTVLPSALNAERRRIEARSWTALGRFDNALEILGKDASPDANDLRAEVTWKEKDWAGAGAAYEKALGDRWKAGGVLSTDEEGRLLRAGVAYSLAGDAAALARMQQRYQGFYDQARSPDALRVALTGEPSGRLSVADFGRVTADNEAFAGWMQKMKQRFRQPPAPAAPTKPTPPVKQAAANAPAKG